MKTLIKFVVICSIIFVLCAIGLFFFLQSEFFIRDVVLPKVQEQTESNITVENIHFSLFRGIELFNLQIEGKDQKPFLQIGAFKFRYHFASLLQGQISIDSILLEDVAIRIHQDGNGNWNFTVPEDAGKEKVQVQQEEESSDMIIPYFSIKNVQVKNLSVEYAQEETTNTPKRTVSLKNFSFSLDHLSPSAPFVVASSAQLSCVLGKDKVSIEQGKITVEGFLSEKYLPETLTIKGRLKKIQSNIAAKSFADYTVTLDFQSHHETSDDTYHVEKCDITVVSVSEGEKEASFSLHGVVSPVSTDAHLYVESLVSSPDILNTIGGIFGEYTFGKTTIKYSSEIKKTASNIWCSGKLDIEKFTISSPEYKIAYPLDIIGNYDLSYQQDNQLAINAITLTVKEAKKQLISLQLSQPTTLSFATGEASANASLDMILTDIDLRWLNPFIPANAKATVENGYLSSTIKCAIRDARFVDIEGITKLRGLELTLQGFRTLPINIEWEKQLNIDLPSQILKLQALNLQIDVAAIPAMSLGIFGEINYESLTGKIDIHTLKITPEITKIIPPSMMAGYDIDHLELTGKSTCVLQKGGKYSFQGSIAGNGIVVTDHATIKTPPLSPVLSWDIRSTSNETLTINKINLMINEFSNPRIDVEITGATNLQDSSGNIAIQCADRSEQLLSLVTTFQQRNPDPGMTEVDISLTSRTPIKAKKLEVLAMSLMGNVEQKEMLEEEIMPEKKETKAIVKQQNADSSGEPTHQVSENQHSVPSSSTTLRMKVDIPELNYAEIIIKNIKTTILLQDEKITLTPFMLLLNEGTIDIQNISYTLDDTPKYKGDISLRDIKLEPIFNTFLPEYTAFLRGNLKQADINVHGVLHPEDALEDVTAKIVGELTDFDCSKITENYGKLLNLIGIKYSDLLFNSVLFDGIVKEQILSLETLHFHNNSLDIQTTGTLALHDAYQPDLTLTIGYDKDAAAWARKQKVKLHDKEDGFAYTEPLPIKLSSWGARDFIGTWIPSVANKLFRLSATEKMAVEGVQTLQGVLKGNVAPKDALQKGMDMFQNFKRKGEKDKTKSDQEPTKKQDTIDTFLNILGR